MSRTCLSSASGGLREALMLASRRALALASRRALSSASPALAAAARRHAALGAPAAASRPTLPRTLATAAGGGSGDPFTPRLSAGAELARIHAALVDAFGAEQAILVDGTIELDLGAAVGHYSLSTETGGKVQQLRLASPVSGARWYEWNASNACWASPDDGHLLVELLVREVMHSTARYINL